MYIPKRTEQSVLGSVHWIVCIEQCVKVCQSVQHSKGTYNSAVMLHLIFDFIALITPNRLPTTGATTAGATTEYLQKEKPSKKIEKKQSKNKEGAVSVSKKKRPRQKHPYSNKRTRKRKKQGHSRSLWTATHDWSTLTCLKCRNSWCVGCVGCACCHHHCYHNHHRRHHNRHHHRHHHRRRTGGPKTRCWCCCKRCFSTPTSTDCLGRACAECCRQCNAKMHCHHC